MSFKREPKMKTTEPSVDEAKMKKGGRTHKAIGGALPAGRITGALPPALSAQMAAAAPRGRAALLASRMPARPSPGIPVMPAKKGGKMAEGGKMESAGEERKEEREIKGVKSELKKHESEKASVAHAGLACGGKMKKATGGVIEKFATGGLVQKFASGGSVKGHDACGFTATKKGGSW